MAHSVSPPYHQLFEDFQRAKWQSGDSWEALFLATLLIRALSHQFDECLFALGRHFAEAAVSADTLLDCFKQVPETPEEFVRHITKPAVLPHIGIYMPQHARFVGLDAIVATWDSTGTRRLYGYQLKEGDGTANKSWNTQDFETCFVVRGTAHRGSTAGCWVTPSKEQLDAFFGVSGSQWTPEHWAALEQLQE